MSTKLPSITSSDGKTTASVTHITGVGNSDGARFSTGGQISHDIGKGNSVFVGGNIDRTQSFHGGGGQTSYGGYVGFSHKF